MSRELMFNIERHIGIIWRNERTGWAKELNLVSWNGGPAKYDIREWDPDHEKMGRGMTLTEDEARKLVDLLDDEL